LYLQKAAKRKKIHAFKSKARFEQLEFAQNKRQNAWQQFQTTKGKAKKVAPSVLRSLLIWLDACPLSFESVSQGTSLLIHQAFAFP